MQDLLMKKGWEINWIPGCSGWWITLTVGIQESCIYHTALPLTPQKRNDGPKDFHWVIFRDTQIQTQHALRAEMHFLMGHPRTTAQNCLSFTSNTTAASSPHYGNSFYRSRPRKASVLACWRLSTCLHVLTNSHFSQLLPLWFTAALCQSPLLSQSAIQPFGSISHGSTLITVLQLLSQNGFPVATPKVYKLLLL